MDPIANDKEQRRVAASIMKIWDECSDDGEFTQSQQEELADAAYRLAELVQALCEWKDSLGRR